MYNIGVCLSSKKKNNYLKARKNSFIYFNDIQLNNFGKYENSNIIPMNAMFIIGKTSY